MSSKKLPNLIIGGVNKAGTTSLHTYLSWHTDICASTIKETNYFVPLLYDNNLSDIDEYMGYFKDCNNRSKYLMESTPRYIYGGRKMAMAIHGQLGSIKIIFLLRDPIQRLFSYFKHMKDTTEVPKEMSFDDYGNRGVCDIDNLKGQNNQKSINVYAENVYVRGLAQGFYSDYLIPWFDVFGDSVQIYFFEGLKENPSKLMNKICKWLEIDGTVYESVNFSVENKRINYKSKWLHNLVGTMNDKFEGYFRTHHPLKKILRNVYYLLNESTEKAEVVSNMALKNLSSVYDPYNKKLFDMLYTKGYSDFPEWLRKYS